MAVQFILGRSGTGKTSYCIEAIVNALLEAGEQSLILLVPEQATYQAERAILADERIAGYHRLHVLSFDRLQFLLLGKNTARPALTRIGQQMVIQKILRDKSSDLRIFGSSARRPGLGRQIARTISELHNYAKTPDDIEGLLKELQKDEHNSLSALKFADISVIFSEYLKTIEDKFNNPDVQSAEVRQAVAKADFVRGAKLWVDGFAGFNSSELEILTELLRVVGDAQIALCLDTSRLDLKGPKNIDPVSIFYPTERTYADLVERVGKCKLQLAKPIILDKAVRFSGCQQLAHVERNMFEGQAQKIPASDNTRVVSAPNARAEVRFVARQILELVKENNYRYRDIAVIASDLERYQHYVTAYFDDYKIPFFIDRRKLLSQHAVVQLIGSAMEVVTGGFLHGDIFAYLKTGLVPVETNDVDLLENYCIAFGVNASDWQGEGKWQFADRDDEEFDEEHVNEIRAEVSGPLFELRDRLCPDDNPKKEIGADEFVQIIFEFLEALGVRKKVAGWIEEASAEGDYATADEHRQFYDKLTNIFDELVEVFAGRRMSCEDYCAIIHSAFSQMTLAFIPPRLDQVLVGSIERSRHPDLKAVFLVGATQRQFPVPVRFDSILTEDDRKAAEKADFELAATASQSLAERQYLAYIAFTRPSQYLCVTYPLADDKGGPVPRSPFVDNLELLFEDLREEAIASEQTELDKIHTKGELAGLLCSELGRDTSSDSAETTREELGELLSDVCSDEGLEEVGSTVLSAVNYDNRAELDERVVKGLFGQKMKGSATRLGTFAACPYQYFARYILELEERKEFKFEPLDLGVFYHCVLDGLLKRLNAEKKDFATVRDEELLKILNKQIAESVQTSSFVSNFVRHSAHNAFIIHSAGEVLEDCVLAIAQMVRAGKFRPRLSEVSFGDVKGARETMGRYELALPDGRLLSVDGKIDRIDIAKLDASKVAVVFDYKRRDRSFSWPRLYYGLDMQLPIYMLAVGNASDSQFETQNVVGAFYMPVEVSPTGAALEELSQRAEGFNYKAKGIFNGEFFEQLDGGTSSGWSRFYSFHISKKDNQYGDYGKSGALRPNDFERVLEFAKQKIIKLAEEILSGRIDVRPYRLGTDSPCSFCDYKAVCRFDWQINDYNFLESVGKTVVLKQIVT
ncbi:MAG: PD-(D/E)XK nuclease family protein [Planctomycetota bacterium]|jgi:ATP-dependent helicase/nuclease subunit B